MYDDNNRKCTQIRKFNVKNHEWKCLISSRNQMPIVAICRSLPTFHHRSKQLTNTCLPGRLKKNWATVFKPNFIQRFCVFCGWLRKDLILRRLIAHQEQLERNQYCWLLPPSLSISKSYYWYLAVSIKRDTFFYRWEERLRWKK